MARRARVTSVDALKEFKVAIYEFIDDAKAAASMIDSDIRRTIDWIQNDRLGYWNGQVKIRYRKVQEAKSDLAQREMTTGKTVDERRALERAKHRLEEAKNKSDLVKRWGRLIQREVDLHRGKLQQLSFALAQDMPRAAVRIDKLTNSIHEYLKLTAPSTEMITGEAPDTVAEYDDTTELPDK